MSTNIRPTEVVTLHFDLSHLDHLPEDQEFHVRGHSKNLRLRRHTPDTHAAHLRTNTALAKMPAEHRARVTHFVEDIEVPTDAVSFYWIGYKSKKPGALMDHVAMAYQHVPSQHVRRAVRAMKGANGASSPAMLQSYGVTFAQEDHADMHVHASQVKGGAGQTALMLVMQHPEIGSLDPALHHRISLLIQAIPSFTDLWVYISEHPADGNNAWYEESVTVVKDENGQVMEPLAGLTGSDGAEVVWPKQTIDGTETPVIPHFQLSSEIDKFAAPVVKEAVRKLKQQPWLKGHSWTTRHGVTMVQRDGGAVASESSPTLRPKRSGGILPMVAATAAADWTIKNITSQYGLDVYDDTLSFDGTNLNFKVKNWPNRGLSVYYQSFNSSGLPISQKEYLQTIGAGNTIFGGPVYTDPVELSIAMPADAAQLDVLLGGLGHGDWDMVVDINGLLYTCFVSYGIPSLMSVMSVGISYTSWYMDFFEKEENIKGLVGIALLCLGAKMKITGDVVGTLEKAAETVANVIFSWAMKQLAIAVTKYTTMSQITQNAPFVGWALRMASIASAVADMIATSVEVANSPATYTLEIKRSMALRVKVSPDPTHGRDDEAAIWPKVADHYVITIQYKGGTTLRKADAMPGSDDGVIDVLFSKATNDELPSAPGEQFMIIAGVYSTSGWLAGQWVSGWIDAQPTDGDKRTEEGSIIERLVPLVADTNYYQREKLQYDAPTTDYVWQNIVFSLPASLETSLVTGAVAKAVVDAFWSKSVRLSNNTTVSGQGGNWTIADAGNGVSYAVAKQPILNEQKVIIAYELQVQNMTHAVPAGTAEDLPKQEVSKLVNITINNLAYRVGYCYYASKQNLPLDYGTAPQSSGMYLLESISSLAKPSTGMKTPTRGFSDGSFIAYDQFGPSGLFALDPAESYMYKLDALKTAGKVPDDIVKAFVANSLILPSDATGVVIKASASWRIATASGQPLFDLRRQIDVIKVFNAPAPEFSPNNFYLDTRTYGKDGVRHLRRVDLQDNSVHTFDYDSTKSWGAFTMTNLDAIVVHPHGYVAAISYRDHQMTILRLPDDAVDDADAPRALPVSGQGVREGLMQGPVAMTITADGRILVLEQVNARIQAFDTFGNPVQCFAAELGFDVNVNFASELDQGTVPFALLQELQNQIPVENSDSNAYDQRYLLTPAFSIDPAFQEALDAKQITPELAKAFEDSALKLEDNVQVFPNGAGRWHISQMVNDRPAGLTYDIRLDGEGNGEIDVYRGMALTVEVKSPAAEWTIRDNTNTLTFDVKKQDAVDSVPQTLHFQRLSSLLRLKTGGSSSTVYLDIAVETKGFIYVLSYTKPDSGPLRTTDYRLDIYNPDGSPVSPDPRATNGHVNGGRMTVDQWRTLFTLNYEQMTGPGGRPEPTVSQWIPTTPSS
ncbi:MAG: hypothetical protein QOD12_2974 [Verrucomicrobiota bacterium]|jgi:hypothetical protein